MAEDVLMECSYFPGCTLATTAKESNESLIKSCEIIGLKLIELEDWNCCGTSSAHALDRELALNLVARNLSLAQDDRPLLVMCPACFKNHLATRHILKNDPQMRRSMERKWGASINPELQIINFLDIMNFLDRAQKKASEPYLRIRRDLSGLTVAPYYGCMVSFPRVLRPVPVNFDHLEKRLRGLGANVVTWAYANRCCGTFLSATRPDIITPIINQIVSGAKAAGADCLVTACAMCQLNLEIRLTTPERIPIFHLSEIIALALGSKDYQGWFNRHLVDPRPLLKQKGLIE